MRVAIKRFLCEFGLRSTDCLIIIYPAVGSGHICDSILTFSVIKQCQPVQLIVANKTFD